MKLHVHKTFIRLCGQDIIAGSSDVKMFLTSQQRKFKNRGLYEDVGTMGVKSSDVNRWERVLPPDARASQENLIQMFVGNLRSQFPDGEYNEAFSIDTIGTGDEQLDEHKVAHQRTVNKKPRTICLDKTRSRYCQAHVLSSISETNSLRSSPLLETSPSVEAPWEQRPVRAF